MRISTEDDDNSSSLLSMLDAANKSRLQADLGLPKKKICREKTFYQTRTRFTWFHRYDVVLCTLT